MIKKIISAIGLITLLLVTLTLIFVSLGLFGKAPKCPEVTPGTKSSIKPEKLLQLNKLTLTDSEATLLAQNTKLDQVEDLRICFTEGFMHISGNFKAKSLKPSFYVSGKVNLNGASPTINSLSIRLGSLPRLPIISRMVESIAEGIINDNLSGMKLGKKYKLEFKEGSAVLSI